MLTWLTSGWKSCSAVGGYLQGMRGDRRRTCQPLPYFCSCPCRDISSGQLAAWSGLKGFTRMNETEWRCGWYQGWMWSDIPTCWIWHLSFFCGFWSLKIGVIAAVISVVQEQDPKTLGGSNLSFTRQSCWSKPNFYASVLECKWGPYKVNTIRLLEDLKTVCFYYYYFLNFLKSFRERMSR